MIITSLGVLFFLGLTLLYPNFWPMFIVPLILFVILQVMAIWNWEHKSKFFNYSDYFYYFMIAGVVALGSRFVIHSDMVSMLDTYIERTSCQQRMIQIDAELPVIRESLSRSKELLKTVDREAAAGCLSKQITERLSGVSIGSKIDPLCEAYFNAMSKTAQYPNRIVSLEQEYKSLNEKLKTIESVFSTKETNLVIQGAKTPKQLMIQFLWLPMFILIGIVIKLGKTTCSFYPFKP